MIQLGVQAAVSLMELAAEIGPHIAAAIRANGELTPEAKASLIARVETARQKVANYTPRDV